MSTATVCRVCLVNNMNLYNVRNYLQIVYERIVREKYEKVGYPIHMCYICLTVLQKCHRFMETAQDTNNVLKQWYKQKNEMREARPLYTYTVKKAELVSTFNEDGITSQYDIKVEEVESEQEEVQQKYAESPIDVKIEKIDIDIDEQTDCSELEVDSSNDRTYTETVEDNNVRKTDPMLDYDEDFEETSSIAPNDHTNIETTINVILPHENDFPPIKEHKTNEAKSQHQTPETSGETTANSETSNDILSLNSTPCQPDNIRHRITKTKPTFDKNNHSDDRITKKLDKIVKKRHITSRSENKLFECNTCPYKSTQKQNLANHMMTHTGEKPFSCDICHYKCARKHRLTSHMRTHTGEKPFSCDICHYKCALKPQLTSHMMTHTGEKPFSCDICRYKSAQKYQLTKHILTHSGEKPFSCDICHYKCARKHQLTAHMRTHTGEKPFSCDICHHKCAQKSHLSRHMMTHTGEKPFSCDICHYKCSRNDKLKNHLITHHVNKKRK